MRVPHAQLAVRIRKSSCHSDERAAPRRNLLPQLLKSPSLPSVFIPLRIQHHIED